MNSGTIFFTKLETVKLVPMLQRGNADRVALAASLASISLISNLFKKLAYKLKIISCACRGSDWVGIPTPEHWNESFEIVELIMQPLDFDTLPTTPPRPDDLADQVR
jgi:hypothetical protein